MNVPIIDWRGKWLQYRHWIYPIMHSFVEQPGNYIFARETQPGFWLPVYIGQTGDLQERLHTHPMKAIAMLLGATHVHVHASCDDETIRRGEESDLIAAWHPPLNSRGCEPSTRRQTLLQSILAPHPSPRPVWRRGA